MDNELVNIQKELEERIVKYDNLENTINFIESKRNSSLSKFSPEAIMAFINESVERLSKERTNLTSTFMSNKNLKDNECEEAFHNFVKEYKAISKEYQIYSILKDKLSNQFSNSFKSQMGGSSYFSK